MNPSQFQRDQSQAEISMFAEREYETSYLFAKKLERESWRSVIARRYLIVQTVWHGRWKGGGV